MRDDSGKSIPPKIPKQGTGVPEGKSYVPMTWNRMVTSQLASWRCCSPKGFFWPLSMFSVETWQVLHEICCPAGSGHCFPVTELLPLCVSPAEWLKPVTAYVLQAGIGQARAEIFRKQIVQNGGHVCDHLSSEVTHVIVAEDMDCDRSFRLLKLAKLPSGLQLVKASWLSACLRDQELLSTTGYRVFIPQR